MYGILNSRGNRLAFSDDSAYYLLCALEILDDDGNFQGKADMFSKRTIQPHKVVTSVDTAVEALTISIGIGLAWIWAICPAFPGSPPMHWPPI